MLKNFQICVPAANPEVSISNFQWLIRLVHACKMYIAYREVDTFRIFVLFLSVKKPKCEKIGGVERVRKLNLGVL